MKKWEEKEIGSKTGKEKLGPGRGSNWLGLEGASPSEEGSVK